MGYQRDETRYASGADSGSRGYRGESGGRYDRGEWRDQRDRDYDERERNFFDRLADELRSWFGDEDAERRRRFDEREDDRRERSRPGWRESGERFRQGDRGGGRDYDRDAGSFASGASISGYGNWSSSYPGSRPSSDDERSGSHHDPHYRSWRDRQIEALDREYDDYRRENQSRFDRDFASWRQKREGRRGQVANIQEHAEVLSADDAHVGTVDKVSGDRIILTKGDSEAEGRHHWIPTSWVDKVDGDKVRLTRNHDDAQRHWHDVDDEQAGGAHMLGRSFAGTY